MVGVRFIHSRLDNDLSTGWSYSLLEHKGPDVLYNLSKHPVLTYHAMSLMQIPCTCKLLILNLRNAVT